jgi:hypothetical protein
MTLGQLIQIATFLALLSVPVVVCIWIRKRIRGFKGFALSFAISAALMSGAIIVQWIGYDWYLEQQIAPLDRNGDGFWTSDEESTWTKEDRRNMDSYFGDGGRNVFAAIIFPAFSATYSLAVVTIYWLFMAAKQRRGKHSPTMPSTGGAKSVCR